MSLQRIWTRGAIYLVLLAFAAFYLMPFYVMVDHRPQALCR